MVERFKRYHADTRQKPHTDIWTDRQSESKILPYLCVCVCVGGYEKAGQPWNPDHGGSKQLGDITDNVSIALTGISMLSDFEP